jgi:MSHA pilin protein MshA
MKALRNEKGFTLIELVLIIVILGILGAIATVQFGSLVSDANEAALDGAAGPYSTQLALTVNSLKRLPDCTEYEVQVFDRVSVSGGKVSSSVTTTCGGSPGTTDVTMVITAGSCEDIWTYDDTDGSFTRTTSTRGSC